MQVLLVHGLGRTPVSLFGLAGALRRGRHATRFFAYAPAFETAPGIVGRLADRLRRLARVGPLGLVGHSLGGLFLRLALDRVPGLPVHHLVMLGTPNRPPRLAARAWRWRAFRWLAGDCGRFLATPDRYTGLPRPAVPFTTIAGTAGPRGRFSPFGFEPNDGVVAVSETTIDPGDEPVRVPGLHTILMDCPAARARVLAIMTTHGPRSIHPGR